MTLLSDTNAHPVACVISYWVNHEVCQCWFHYSFLAICLIRLNTACVGTFGTKLLCNHIFQNYCANHIVSKTKQLLIMQGWASTVPKSCLSSYAIFEESLSFDFQLRFLSRQYVMQPNFGLISNWNEKLTQACSLKKWSHTHQLIP